MIIEINDNDPQALQAQLGQVIELMREMEKTPDHPPLILRTSTVEIEVSNMKEVSAISAGMTFMLNALNTTFLLLGPAAEV